MWIFGLVGHFLLQSASKKYLTRAKGHGWAQRMGHLQNWICKYHWKINKLVCIVRCTAGDFLRALYSTGRINSALPNLNHQAGIRFQNPPGPGKDWWLGIIYTDGEAVIMLAFQASGRGSTPLQCIIICDGINVPTWWNIFQIKFFDSLKF